MLAMGEDELSVVIFCFSFGMLCLLQRINIMSKILPWKVSSVILRNQMCQVSLCVFVGAASSEKMKGNSRNN